MEIALITEGTYPYYHGGVSVWCDQLLREVSEHRFTLVALSATGRERAVWQFPPNVSRIVNIPLWAAGDVRHRKRQHPHWEGALERFLSSLSVDAKQADFVKSLKELAYHARDENFRSVFFTESAVQMLLKMRLRCSERTSTSSNDAPMNVSDAVTVMISLANFLRPLGADTLTADVCHSVANGLGALPALLTKWQRGTPFLLTEHGLYLRERYLSYKPGTLGQSARAVLLRFFRLLVELAYREADWIVPGSQYNRLWERTNGAEPRRITTIHNGVEVKNFKEAPCDPVTPTLSWIGRIDPLKDLETLIRSFQLVRNEIPGSQLRMFGAIPQGGSEYFRRCQALISDLGLAGSASFEGRVDSPVAAYHAGHVVLLTSISEGLPYTVVEAMACGRPVVATDVGGVSEVVGRCGLMAPPRDPKAIATACVRLLRAPDERKRLGAEARQRVIEEFTAKQCFDEYRNVYEDLHVTGSCRRWGWEVFRGYSPAGAA